MTSYTEGRKGNDEMKTKRVVKVVGYAVVPSRIVGVKAYTTAGIRVYPTKKWACQAVWQDENEIVVALVRLPRRGR